MLGSNNCSPIMIITAGIGQGLTLIIDQVYVILVSEDELFFNQFPPFGGGGNSFG